MAQLFSLGILAPPFMKSKQLANVLIKTAGLYICLCAIPGLVSAVLLVFLPVMGVKWSDSLFSQCAYAIGHVVQAAVGILIITKSRKIAETWFKNDDE